MPAADRIILTPRRVHVIPHRPHPADSPNALDTFVAFCWTLLVLYGGGVFAGYLLGGAS